MANIKHPERIYIISRQQNDGWLTVDSKTLDRNQAFEKQSTKLVNRETSPTSPSWMQNVNNLKRDEDTLKALHKKHVFGIPHSRVEKNRVILFDTQQPLHNTDHLQSTNSIFHRNDIVAGKRKFH